MPSIEELVSIKEQVTQRFLGQPGIRGIDVGFKEVGGRLTDQVAVRIHVAEKTDDIPPGQRVPVEISGAVTDVIERVYKPQVTAIPVEMPLQADTEHLTTLQGGVSMGPSRTVDDHIFAGTLGAIVIDNATHDHAALTNFHVAPTSMSPPSTRRSRSATAWRNPAASTPAPFPRTSSEPSCAPHSPTPSTVP